MVDQAEIHRKSLSDNIEDRREAAIQLRTSFANLPDKECAWQDLHRLTDDEDGYVRSWAAYALGAPFSAVPDKGAAWKDLHRLTGDEESSVRSMAAYALGAAFSAVPDKESALKDLHTLICDEDWDVRFGAAFAFGGAFSAVPDKDAAWQDLHRLTGDEHRLVRFWAANALGGAFSAVPDKDSAWQDLHRLTSDKDSSVRSMAAKTLGGAFSAVIDKDAAWQDLHRLTGDEDCDVRMRAARVLGAAFSAVPDKDAAWQDLHRLTGDEDYDVRVSANHSLGKASIFKATEAEGEENFRRELENALQYFERSMAESPFYNKDAKFCLLFYKSFHIIAFKEANSMTELNRYLNQAKNVAKGSRNREQLLEIIEHLSKAQKEAQSAEEMNLDAMKCYLNIYRKHCESASDLLRSTEENSPIAAKLIRKRTPIIDYKIRETIKAVLDAVEAKNDPESELRGTLDAMQQTLSEIQQQNIYLQETLKRDIECSRKVINDPELGVADKLKLTIPIIPRILSYERIIELKSGMNLSAAWQRLVNRDRRRK